MSKPFNVQFALQKLRETKVEEESATGAEGAHLTKPGAKKNSPKPTSGYKEVKGYRPGHSKLKIVEPKDLWGLNEVGEKPEPEHPVSDKDGDEVTVGKKVRINTPTVQDGTGVVTAFTKDSKGKDIPLTTVNRDKDSSQPREKVPVDPSDIDAMEDDSLNEGIKTEIKRRNKTQQFAEAAKMVNKRLKEINSILEYAQELEESLDEGEKGANSHIMEKMKKGMVKAYAKMKNLRK